MRIYSNVYFYSLNFLVKSNQIQLAWDLFLHSYEYIVVDDFQIIINAVLLSVLEISKFFK
jgi:hypothetical protein